MQCSFDRPPPWLHKYIRLHNMNSWRNPSTVCELISMTSCQTVWGNKIVYWRKLISDFYDTEYAWCKLPEKEGKSKNSFMGTRQCFAHMHSRSTYLTEVNCWLGNRVGIPGMFKRGIERCSHFPIKIRQNLRAQFRSRKSENALANHFDNDPHNYINWKGRVKIQFSIFSGCKHTS